jgi:integrase
LDEPETQRKRQSSANRCLSLLKAALNYAWREKKVDSNDAWQRVELFRGVDIPRAISVRCRVAEIDKRRTRRLSDFGPSSPANGARYQELARLRVSDFDSAVGTLHIRKTKTHKDRHWSGTNRLPLSKHRHSPITASNAGSREGVPADKPGKKQGLPREIAL